MDIPTYSKHRARVDYRMNNLKALYFREEMDAWMDEEDGGLEVEACFFFRAMLCLAN